MRRKIPNRMVVWYATRSPTLVILVELILVEGVTESLGYVLMCGQHVHEENSATPGDKKLLEPHEKLVNTAAPPSKGPSICQQYALSDSYYKIAEP